MIERIQNLSKQIYRHKKTPFLIQETLKRNDMQNSEFFSSRLQYLIVKKIIIIRFFLKLGCFYNINICHIQILKFKHNLRIIW